MAVVLETTLACAQIARILWNIVRRSYVRVLECTIPVVDEGSFDSRAWSE